MHFVDQPVSSAFFLRQGPPIEWKRACMNRPPSRMSDCDRHTHSDLALFSFLICTILTFSMSTQRESFVSVPRPIIRRLDSGRWEWLHFHSMHSLRDKISMWVSQQFMHVACHVTQWQVAMIIIFWTKVPSGFSQTAERRCFGRHINVILCWGELLESKSSPEIRNPTSAQEKQAPTYSLFTCIHSHKRSIFNFQMDMSGEYASWERPLVNAISISLTRGLRMNLQERR